MRTGICQRELRSAESRMRWSSIIFLLLFAGAEFFFGEFFGESGEGVGVDLTGLEEIHEEAFDGTAEHAVEHVLEGVAAGCFVADGGAVLVGATAESALHLFLAVEDVEHGLDGGVSEGWGGGEGVLYGLDVAGTVGPEDLHDLELEWSEDVGRWLSFGHGILLMN